MFSVQIQYLWYQNYVEISRHIPHFLENKEQLHAHVAKTTISCVAEVSGPTSGSSAQLKPLTQKPESFPIASEEQRRTHHRSLTHPKVS
jgi:hypothetical protein